MSNLIHNKNKNFNEDEKMTDHAHQVILDKLWQSD